MVAFFLEVLDQVLDGELTAAVESELPVVVRSRADYLAELPAVLGIDGFELNHCGQILSSCQSW